MPPLASLMVVNHLREQQQLSVDEADDATQFSGYVEVTAVEDPSSGLIKDKITVVLPLPDKALDEDPLYYYPPSTPDSAKISDDEDSSDSDSDDDEDEDDHFPVNLRPRIITNRHRGSKMGIMHNDNNDNDDDALVASTSTIDPALEYSFMEELLQTLDTIFGCSSYGACGGAAEQKPILKSVLRRKSSADPVPTPQMNRSVSFTKLEIREFNMTLGNHPSAVTGPPVMLDWDARPTKESVIDLDSYEKARQPRRTRRQLKLSFEARRGILENDRGFTVEEVKKAWSEALTIRKQRQETRQRTPQQQMFDEVYESACRKYNRLFDWNS